MGLSIRVKEVKPIGDMLLNVIFENGVNKRYDVRQLVSQFPIYKALEGRGIVQPSSSGLWRLCHSVERRH